MLTTIATEKESCEADCLHHIFGRVSNSPFNACPANNKRCHINHDGKMGGHSRLNKYEVKQTLLTYAINWLCYHGYIPTKEDKTFLEKHASSENLAELDKYFK
jgi:hypothetical protein